MTRRSFLSLSALPAVAAAMPPVEDELKITGVRIVRTKPRRPVPAYEPAPGSWSTHGVEVASIQGDADGPCVDGHDRFKRCARSAVQIWAGPPFG